MAVATDRLRKAPERPLGNRCYIDPEHFEAELERLWTSGWFCVAFAQDVPQPGDVAPVGLGRRPLLLVRDREGRLRVFWNVCRHRGMVLVTEPGHCPGVIRCPYHSWSYALDGTLKATPHVGGPGRNTDPAIDRDGLGLVEVRTAEWLGCVFVDLGGRAPPFAEFITPLAGRWADFAGRQLVPGGSDCRFTLEVRCNWKLAVENYCESYHLPWVHPGLNSYSRLEDHYDILGATFAGQGTRAYRPLLADDGRRLPGFTDLPEQWREGAEYVALIPTCC